MTSVLASSSLGALFGPLFHTGIVVDSIDRAMQDYTDAFNLEWAPTVRRTGPIHTLAGLQPRDMIITYSKGVGHHIELVEYLDDTAYRYMRSGPAHHIGFWVDDLSKTITALEAAGYPSEAAGAGEDGSVREFSYHYNPHASIWLEIVDTAIRPGFERWTRPSGR